MGVPAFYRWIQEKYPKCVVDCVESRAVVLEGEHHYELMDTTGPNPNGFEVDNLYVDMNGLIHPCAHPEHGEAPKTEEEMYRRIMAYVDRLVAAVRPRRVLYLAIDGVAPRAKMNQQRARRFRAAQEAEQRMEVEKEALEYMKALGHSVPSKQEKAWDSNVITPGTKFMSKLAKYMRFYIRDRINNNPAWKSMKVIFSDAGVPGEGEHKLMQYIRVQRSQPGYDPNQHHVLHGLDADLIMLGLATHEVKFSILREEVLFGKQKYEREREKQKTVLDANGVPDHKRKRGDFGEHDGDLIPSDQKPLQFLHIATLREYLKIEFEPLSLVLPFEYDFERVIDDFVFLCFFVGNDFLPHLPSLDIRDGALDFLILIYAKLLPAMGGYLTDTGEVDLARVDVILAEVGAVEDVIFQRRALKQDENERRRKSRISYEKRDQIAAAAAKNDAVEIVKKRRIDKDVIAADKKYGGLTAEEAVKARIKESVETQLEKYRDEVQDVVRLGEPGWKTRYYSDKMKADDIEHGGGREKVFQSYIEGLCWVMKYYYSGCASWQWFYPFHYAPFASDLRNIDRFTISFDEGQPFRPFEQLMGVFPSGSSHAIPKPYRWLMSEEESPIIDFYPKDIPVDPNGKAMPWLWVVLLPFIDESRLLEAMQPGNAQLTEAEKKRNERFGREIVFFHSKCPVIDVPPTAENPEGIVNPKISESFNGTLIYVDSVYFPIGCIVPSPEKSQQHLQDIPNNQCFSFQYRLPPKQTHVCRILDGATPPAPVLVSDQDKRISIPFFGKANINIIDLAGSASALTNVHNNSGGRGGGRGGGYGGRGNGGFGGRGGYNNQQQGNYTNNNLNVNRYNHDQQGGQQYNQYLTNGSGHWGSQEPRNKRGQFGAHSSSGTSSGYGGGNSYNNQSGSSYGHQGIEALKAGLRNMHQQRGSLPPNQQGGGNSTRYDR
uniref:5'-3' exoribonuclease n=1 Tax=Globisporangium ultimum (strain ATCC 200006 / CBS 805.95 / DAOM BR144) TaxID=431595 RepID=K3X1Z0_GLOUD